MANLPLLLPTAYDSESGTVWAITIVDRILNGVDTPDGYHINSGLNAISSIYYQKTNMPSDFSRMLTLTFRIRYRVMNLTNDTEKLFVSVFNSDKTILFTNEILVDTLTSTSALITSPVISFTLSSEGQAATKQDWDNALIRIRTYHIANAADDDSWWRVDEIELNGTYEPAAWQTKSVKYFNGSNWVTGALKHYNGSAWVTKPTKIYM